MFQQTPGANHLMIDLHGCSVQETKQLLQEHFAKIETDNITEIYIITGRGKHVNPDGSRGVLKKLLPKLLQPYDPDIIQINKEIQASRDAREEFQPSFARMTRLKVGLDSSGVRHALILSGFMPAPSTMTLRRDALPASPTNARLSRALRLRIALAILSLSHRAHTKSFYVYA